jgi:hypothetical protein
LRQQLAILKRQLSQVIAACVEYLNESRLHQGGDQHVPCGPPTRAEPTSGNIIAFSVLGGLHHEHRPAA